jgi:hypothetical protein
VAVGIDYWMLQPGMDGGGTQMLAHADLPLKVEERTAPASVSRARKVVNRWNSVMETIDFVQLQNRFERRD